MADDRLLSAAGAKLIERQDTKAQKATYPSIVGLEKSRKIAAQLTDKAFAALGLFRGRAVALEALAAFLLKRDR